MRIETLKDKANAIIAGADSTDINTATLIRRIRDLEEVLEDMGTQAQTAEQKHAAERTELIRGRRTSVNDAVTDVTEQLTTQHLAERRKLGAANKKLGAENAALRELIATASGPTPEQIELWQSVIDEA